MIERQPYLPRWMAGGPGNPLGARALYLGSTVYRIHGTNQPQTIGTAVSSGCFRLTNPDVDRSLRPDSGRHQGDRPAAARSLTGAGRVQCAGSSRWNFRTGLLIGCLDRGRGRGGRHHL